MKPYIIRECDPECGTAYEWYFDDDGITPASGDYCNTVFITTHDHYRRVCSINTNEFDVVIAQAEGLASTFDEIASGDFEFYNSYKDAMLDYGIPYTPKRCHELKELLRDFDSRYNEQIAEYLSITTGKKWVCNSFGGYCQGDYCEIIYCKDNYNYDAIEEMADMFLGCYKEFCIVELNLDGKEVDTIYGFAVHDSAVQADEDYKRIVCQQADMTIKPEDAVLELIDGYTTKVVYSYRTI